MKKIKSFKKQSGYTATAMIAMLAVGGIVTAGTARHTLSATSEAQGQTYGTALAGVNKSVGTYTVLYYKSLIDGAAVPGVAIPLQPTVQELNALSLGSAQVNPTPPMGGTYAIEISREPVGCVAPNCNLTSRTWFTRPITNPDTGNVDIERLGAAAQAIGGDGGWSAPDAPGTVRGTAGWARANPTGNTAGILMAINGYGSSVFANYIDRQGVQGMLADLKLGGNNINGIGTVNAQGVVLPAGRGIAIGQVWIAGHASGDATIYQPGSLHIEKPDSSPADIAMVRSINSVGQVNTRRLIANGRGLVGGADQGLYDVSAGTIAAGQSVYSYDKICAGNSDASCNGSGGVVMRSNGDISAAGNSWVNVSHGNEMVTSGWYRSSGTGGWYSEAFGGGLHMTDPDWIRTYNNKSMYTGGQMQAGSLQSNGSLSVAGNSSVGSQTVHNSQIVGGDHTVYGSTRVSNAIVPGAIASEGAWCGNVPGAIGRDGNNNLFICN